MGGGDHVQRLLGARGVVRQRRPLKDPVRPQ